MLTENLQERLDRKVKMEPNYDPEQFTAGWANCTLRSKTNSPYILLIGSILSLFSETEVWDEHEGKFISRIGSLHSKSVSLACLPHI